MLAVKSLGGSQLPKEGHDHRLPREPWRNTVRDRVGANWDLDLTGDTRRRTSYEYIHYWKLEFIFVCENT